MQPSLRSPFVAQRLAVALLLGGIALLVVEVRFEHHVVLADKTQAWVPLIYGAAMLALGALALPLWRRGGRQAMAWGFAFGVPLGVVGFFFHAKGDPASAVADLFRIVLRSPGDIVTDGGGPPILAPLAWFGLGLLGVVVCMPVYAHERARGAGTADRADTARAAAHDEPIGDDTHE
ncbi:MAG: hypothetical protein IT373_06135 [Polyangiaceae bacterium]|nr:hypothetical protein [Polyangiaceae bacterium]